MNNEGITQVWQKWRFSAPQTQLWFIKVLVICINICGENRQLRQAETRYSTLGRVMTKPLLKNKFFRNFIFFT
jgi:hypothetical protein